MAKFFYSGSDDSILNDFPKWSSNIFITLNSLLNANARGTKKFKYLDPRPFFNKWGIGYSEPDGQEIPEQDNQVQKQKEYTYARTDALDVGVENLDYTAGKLGDSDNIEIPSNSYNDDKEWNNIINLLMPQYARRVEVEDLDKNFWVIGVTLDCIINALWGKGSSVIETILDIIQELIDIRNMIGGTDILEVSMSIGNNDIKNLYEPLALYDSKILLKSEKSIREVAIPIVHFNSDTAHKDENTYVNTYNVSENIPSTWEDVCKIYNERTVMNNNKNIPQNAPFLSDSDLFFTDNNINEQLTFKINFDKIYIDSENYMINRYYVDNDNKDNIQLQKLVAINNKIVKDGDSSLYDEYKVTLNKQYGEKLKYIRLTYYNLENSNFKNITNIETIEQIINNYYNDEDNNRRYTDNEELNCIQLVNSNGYSTTRYYGGEEDTGEKDSNGHTIYKPVYFTHNGKLFDTINFEDKILYNHYKLFNHEAFIEDFNIPKTDCVVLTDFDELEFDTNKCIYNKDEGYVEIINPSTKQCLIIEYHQTNVKEGYTQKFWKEYVAEIFKTEGYHEVGNLYDDTLFNESADITIGTTTRQIGTQNGWMIATRDENLIQKDGTINTEYKTKILNNFNGSQTDLYNDFKYFSLGSQAGIDIHYWSGNWQINNMIDSSLNYAYAIISCDKKATSKVFYIEKIASPGLYYDDGDWMEGKEINSNVTIHQLKQETLDDTIASYEHFELNESGEEGNDDYSYSIVGKQFTQDSPLIVWSTKYTYSDTYSEDFRNYKYIVEFTDLVYGDGRPSETGDIIKNGIDLDIGMQEAEFRVTFGKSIQDNGQLLTQRLYNIYSLWQSNKSDVLAVGELSSLGLGDIYRLPPEAYIVLYGAYDNDSNTIDKSYQLLQSNENDGRYILSRIKDDESDIPNIQYKFPSNCLFLQSPELYNYEIVSFNLSNGDNQYKKYLNLKSLPSKSDKIVEVPIEIDSKSSIASTLQLQNNFGVRGYSGDLQTYNMSPNIFFYKTNYIKDGYTQGIGLSYFIPEIRNYKNYTSPINYYKPEISIFTKADGTYSYVPKQLQSIELFSNDLNEDTGNVLLNEFSLSGENENCDSFAGGGYMRNNKCIHSFSNLFVKNSTTTISNDNSIHLGNNLQNLPINELYTFCLPTYSYESDNKSQLFENLNNSIDPSKDIDLAGIFNDKSDIIATEINNSHYSTLFILLRKYNLISESTQKDQMLNLIETLLGSITYYYRNVIDLGFVRLISDRVVKPINITNISCTGTIGGNAYRNVTNYMLLGIKRKDIDNNTLTNLSGLYPGKIEILDIGKTGLNTDTIDNQNNQNKYININAINWSKDGTEGIIEQNLGYGQKYIGYILLLWSQYTIKETDEPIQSAGSLLAQVRNLRLYGETTPGYIIF